MVRSVSICLISLILVGVWASLAQETGGESEAVSAFEEGRWDDAIGAYQGLLALSLIHI